MHGDTIFIPRKVGETDMHRINTESTGDVTSHPRLGVERHAPIFIGGQRRSGTTLMRTMLNRHPHIALVPRESFFIQDRRFETFFDDLLAWHSKRFAKMGIGPSEMDRAVAALIDHLFMPFALHKGAHRWADKTTVNITRIDYLFRLFPGAQFIHLIRDPRDTLCSMKQQAATDKPNWVKFTAEVTAPEWVACIAAGLPWRARPERYLEVRYEHLARDPEAVMRRVLAFLGEPWYPAVLDPSADAARPHGDGGNHHKAVENHHKAVFTSSIGRWKRDLSPDEVACIESIASETMALLGYHREVV
jgi:hypothetical protein